MTTKTQKVDLLNEYVSELIQLKPLAEKAYGSRNTKSAEHDASREYTTLLTEYTRKGGSLLMMANALDVTYSALRRRVMTADVKPLKYDLRHRSKATPEQYSYAVATLTPFLNGVGDTDEYHDTLLKFYDEGLSINHLAKELGFKGAYHLYYGISKARMRKNTESK